MKIGDRVQIPVWSDRWMMGDRYGVVVKLTKPRPRSKFQAIHATGDVAHVRLDKSGRVFKCQAKDCTRVEDLP